MFLDCSPCVIAFPYKTCSRCGEVKPIDQFSRGSQYGYQFQCKLCNREYRQANAEHITERERAYNQANAERKREYRRANAQRIAKRTREYRRVNIDRYKEQQHEYRQVNAERLTEQRREYRQANAERYKEQQRKYHQANAERLKEYNREYWQANIERIKKQKREYRKANADRIKERSREYQRSQAGRAADKVNRNRRAARKRGLDNTLTAADWQAALDYFGGCCAACGRPQGLWHTLAADHWIPISKGGPTTPDNIVPLCHGVGGCNNSKNDRDATEWLVERFGPRKGRAILRRIEAYLNSRKAEGAA
jgi:hypothetical protein